MGIINARLINQLETEQSLLIPKSRAALSRYGHQLVIGNELHSRKYKVVFVERQTGEAPRKAKANGALSGAQTPPIQAEDLPEVFTEKWLKLDEGEGEKEIEELIIQELVGRHTKWIEHA
jgi:phosphopantothenate-cysteine ligase